VCGIRPFAASSRICRALASPFYYNTLKVVIQTFASTYGLGSVALTLTPSNDSKLLRLRKPCIARGPYRGLPAIEDVLKYDNSYAALEYLPSSESIGAEQYYQLTASALGTLSGGFPLLRKLVIELGDFIGGADGVGEFDRKRSWLPKDPTMSALDKIQALGRFPNLRHLQLHLHLNPDTIEIMRPQTGPCVALHIMDLLQSHKTGVRLEQLDLVFWTFAKHFLWNGSYSTETMSVVMTCKIGETVGSSDKYVTSCDGSVYAKIIAYRKKIEKLGKRVRWNHDLNPSIYANLVAEYPDQSRARRICSKAVAIPSLVFSKLHKRWRKVASRPKRILHARRVQGGLDKSPPEEIFKHNICKG